MHNLKCTCPIKGWEFSYVWWFKFLMQVKHEAKSQFLPGVRLCIFTDFFSSFSSIHMEMETQKKTVKNDGIKSKRKYKISECQIAKLRKKDFHSTL